MRRQSHGLLAVVILGGLPAPPVAAVEIIPAVSAGVVYTDNLRLAGPGQEEDDVVGFIQPGIRIASNGQRYDFLLDYRLQSVFYKDADDSNGTFSIGSTSLAVEVLPQNFLVTGEASIRQVVVDPEQQVPISNLPVTGNLQDQIRYSVTPEWRQQLLGGDLRLSATTGRIMFESKGFQDIDYLQFNNSWLGPERERGLTWGLTHEYASYDYQVIEIKRHAVDLSMYAELGGGWAPFVTVGAESDFAEPTEDDLNYFTYSVGLRRSTELSRIEVSYGDRSFGTNLRVSAERKFGGDPANLIRASYRETPSPPPNIRQVQFQRSEPPLDPGLPDTEAPPLLPDQLAQSFLNKRGDLVLQKGFIRSTLTLRLFWWDAKSVPFGSRADEIDDSRTQTGLSARYNYKFGQKLSAFLFATYAEREFKRDGVVSTSDTLINGRVGLIYDFSRNGSVRFWVGTDRREDPEGESAPVGFEQNVAGIMFTQTFR